ncbi:MAG: protein-glutamate O-methyltransferase CheR [Victivallaceae bacterium]
MIEPNRRIAELLISLYGIDVSQYEPSFLDKAIQRRIDDTHSSSAAEYCRVLEQNHQEAKYFIDSLKISYSEFFRNPLTFAVLEQLVLPRLTLKMKHGKRNEIRVWSAACAAGQEAYSLAMLLEELKTPDNEINYRIFATDKSGQQIIEAQNGHYPEAALNRLSLKRVKEWFKKSGDTYTVKSALKKHIEFSTFDLLSENPHCPPASIFGEFNLVFCANILFYYKNERREVILKKIKKCLIDGGCLITGEAERNVLIENNFREIFPKSAIFILE